MVVKNDSQFTALKVEIILKEHGLLPIAQSSWESVIPKGESLHVDVDDSSDHCTFDIRIIMSGKGRGWLLNGVDVCAEPAERAWTGKNVAPQVLRERPSHHVISSAIGAGMPRSDRDQKISVVQQRASCPSALALQNPARCWTAIGTPPASDGR
jgi:hypothetical protein